MENVYSEIMQKINLLSEEEMNKLLNELKKKIEAKKNKSKHENKNWLGFLKDKTEIVGDIIEPASDIDDWEVLKD